MPNTCAACTAHMLGSGNKCDVHGPSDRKPSGLASPRFNDPDAGKAKGRPTGASLFTLVGIHPGEEPEPMTHLVLSLVDALTQWRHILQQEAFCLACLGGRAEVRLVRVDSIR